MAHPKRKTSKTRRDKRRTHYKARMSTLSVCGTTSETHRRHRAYVVDGNLYYNGKVVVDNYEKV